MLNDSYDHNGRDQHLNQRILLAWNDDNSQPAAPNKSSSPAQWEQKIKLQYSSLPCLQDMHRNDKVQQLKEVESFQAFLNGKKKVAKAYHHQTTTRMHHEPPPGSSPSLDGQSLYCTEVLPSTSPPSKPITVQGESSQRGRATVTRGGDSQPVQYTIFITKPQFQQSTNHSTISADSILVNTLLQQREQQRLQQHIALALKANSSSSSLSANLLTNSCGNLTSNLCINSIGNLSTNLLTNSSGNFSDSLSANSIDNLSVNLPANSSGNLTATLPANNSGNLTANVPVNSENILLSNNNINGSNKPSNLLINNSNLCSGSSGTSTFPTANLIVNGLSNGLDNKNIQLTNLTLTENNNLPVILNSGCLDRGIVILKYSDPHPQTVSATASITDINQLVATHRKVPECFILNAGSSSNSSNTEVKNIILDSGTKREAAKKSQTDLCCNSVYSQGDIRAQSGDSEQSNKQIVINKQIVEIVNSSESNVSNNSELLTLSSEQQLLESAPFSDSVSVGMHSGRTGPGSGQAHNIQQQQQQQHIPTSNSSNSPVATVAANQSVMLSAGQPALPSGIFRTGGDNTSPRFTTSGNYIHTQYPSIYGIHGQSTAHLTLQPYSTFFPGFGGTSSSGHTICHGPLVPGTGQAPYPQVESYSAMLASMGSHMQHRCPQGADRTPRTQVSEVTVSQHVSPFLTSVSHLAASGVQYPTSLRHLTDSRSSSPGKVASVNSPTSVGMHQDPLSSRHLEKMASMKGSSSLHGRDGDVAREMIYGNPILHEDKPALSPRSYSSTGHAPKVSFDTIVKEYGGSRECPSGRADLYTRSSLSGKEGSLKHRILTRPSDSDMPDDYSQVSGTHGLKDEPLTKRPKLTSHGATSLMYGVQTSPAHHRDHQKSSNLAEALTASHHSVSKSSISKDTKGTGLSYHLDNSVSEYHIQQQHSPHQQPHCENSSTDKRFKQQQHYHSSPSVTPPTTSPSSQDVPSHLQYPSHFQKGSIIQLANGSLKRVEDLQTEDFVSSAEISADLKVDSSTVVKIEENPSAGTAMLSFSVGEHRVQVTVEATLEHPFFVFGQGWSSCSVSRTLARYGLDCQKLNVGDVCISLTHKDVNLKAAEIGQQQQQSSVTDPHHPAAVTSSTETLERQSLFALATSSSTLSSSTSASDIFSNSSMILTSSANQQHTNTSTLHPPLSTSTSSSKQRFSQIDLPPPLSKIVLVKKETSNNNNTRKRDSQRVDIEVKVEALSEEDNESHSASLSPHERRWSAIDQGSLKADWDTDKVKHIQDNEEIKNEKTLTSTDNGRQ